MTNKKPIVTKRVSLKEWLLHCAFQSAKSSQSCLFLFFIRNPGGCHSKTDEKLKPVETDCFRILYSFSCSSSNPGKKTSENHWF